MVLEVKKLLEERRRMVKGEREEERWRDGRKTDHDEAGPGKVSSGRISEGGCPCPGSVLLLPICFCWRTALFLNEDFYSCLGGGGTKNIGGMVKSWRLRTGTGWASTTTEIQ